MYQQTSDRISTESRHQTVSTPNILRLHGTASHPKSKFRALKPLPSPYARAEQKKPDSNLQKQKLQNGVLQPKAENPKPEKPSNLSNPENPNPESQVSSPTPLTARTQAPRLKTRARNSYIPQTPHPKKPQKSKAQPNPGNPKTKTRNALAEPVAVPL